MAKRTAGTVLALSLTLALSAACGGDFDGYDDKIFDFPETAAPPVPNPIPPDPEPSKEAAEPPAPSADRPQEAPKTSPQTPPDKGASDAAEKAKGKKGRASQTGVQSIKLRGDGKDSSAQSETSAPMEARGSETLDETSEGPGRAKPESEPPPKNVGRRHGSKAERTRPMDEEGLMERLERREARKPGHAPSHRGKDFSHRGSRRENRENDLKPMGRRHLSPLRSARDGE